MLQGQVRIIARAGASARTKLLVIFKFFVRLGPSLEFRDFFCIHWSTNRNGAFPRISFTRFSLWTFRNISHYFFLCPVSISRIMNTKKNSKFEREDKSNGNPLLHHGIFFSFTRIFLWTFRTIPHYFFYAVLLFLE